MILTNSCEHPLDTHRLRQRMVCFRIRKARGVLSAAPKSRVRSKSSWIPSTPKGSTKPARFRIWWTLTTTKMPLTRLNSIKTLPLARPRRGGCSRCPLHPAPPNSPTCGARHVPPDCRKSLSAGGPTSRGVLFNGLGGGTRHGVMTA